jgi:hypothetical protein
LGGGVHKADISVKRSRDILPKIWLRDVILFLFNLGELAELKPQWAPPPGLVCVTSELLACLIPDTECSQNIGIKAFNAPTSVLRASPGFLLKFITKFSFSPTNPQKPLAAHP